MHLSFIHLLFQHLIFLLFSAFGALIDSVSGLVVCDCICDWLSVCTRWCVSNANKVFAFALALTIYFPLFFHRCTCFISRGKVGEEEEGKEDVCLNGINGTARNCEKEGKKRKECQFLMSPLLLLLLSSMAAALTFLLWQLCASIDVPPSKFRTFYLVFIHFLSYFFNFAFTLRPNWESALSGQVPRVSLILSLTIGFSVYESRCVLSPRINLH